MTHLFISYSRSDRDFAQKLTDTLRDKGVEVFLDVQDISAGEKWSTTIQRALDAAEVMLLIVSPASMQSPNVEDEWQYFLDNKKPILPILWLPAKLHFQLNRMQYVNFNGVPFETALNNLFVELIKKGVQVNVAPSAKPAPEPASKRASLEFARLPHAIEPNAKLKKSEELFGGPDTLPTTKAIKKGEAVEIIGRTPNSDWLHLKTAGGQQGWLPRGVIGLLVDIHTIPVTADNPPEQRVDFMVPRRLLYGLITLALVVVIGTAIYFSGLLPDGDDKEKASDDATDQPTELPTDVATEQVRTYPDWIDLILPEQPISGVVTFTGTANHPDMVSYRVVIYNLSYTVLDTIFESEERVVDDVLAEWDSTSYANGTYWVALDIIDENDRVMNQITLPFEVDNPTTMQIGITGPSENTTVSQRVGVWGTATMEDFVGYRLEYGPDPNPNNVFFPMVLPESSNPVEDFILGWWETTLVPDGVYQIRVTMWDTNDTQVSSLPVKGIRVDNSAD